MFAEPVVGNDEATQAMVLHVVVPEASWRAECRNNEGNPRLAQSSDILAVAASRACAPPICPWHCCVY